MQRVRRLTVSARAALMLVLLLQGAFSFADDTEIFLSRGKSDVKPNVFFVLDDSLSMGWCFDREWVYPETSRNQHICAGGEKVSRMSALKNSLRELISEMKDVNFGLMTLSRRQSLAIKPIDSIRSDALKIAI